MQSRNRENGGISIALVIVAVVMLVIAFAAGFYPDPVVRFTGIVVAVAIIIVIFLTYSGSKK